MCGIVGYVGNKNAGPILLEALKRLEYRGYDSAGVATCNNGCISLFKSKGRLTALCEKTDDGNIIKGQLGIGHTRWATHGEPNDVNAHPHLSMNGKFAVVHNGIIENYATLKEMLIDKGYTFKSETDTEVIANLLDFHYLKSKDLFEAVNCMLDTVKGAYALGIICSDFPDRILATRKDAPLLIGYGSKESYIASDVTAILQYTRNIAYLNDGELAILTSGSIRVYDERRRPVKKEKRQIEWDVSAAEKCGFEHFMLKEIYEQPKAIKNTAFPHLENNRVVFNDLSLSPEQIRSINRIYIVACGSSYHVGMVGKYNLEHMLRKNVEVYLASEFRYSDPLITTNDLVIVISQSGETLDTMAALREAKKRGARILSIVNVVGSTIARESDDVIYTWAGPEIAVATTKAYSTQMILLDMLGLYFGDIIGTVDHRTYSAMVEEIQNLPEKIEKILNSAGKIKDIAKKFSETNEVFFIGRNLDYALSLEGSLKLKEISYILSEAYAAGELKHGTISLIQNETPVIATCLYKPLFDKTMSNIVEVQARGASVVALITESQVKSLENRIENYIVIPDTELMLQPQLGIVPLQMLAYYIAYERGCDIDKPRNLAKSVTVE